MAIPITRDDRELMCQQASQLLSDLIRKHDQFDDSELDRMRQTLKHLLHDLGIIDTVAS